MLGYILVCLVACTILAALSSNIVHSCLIIRVYAYVWMVMHHLCMFMFAYSQVYGDIMIMVVMHEVVVSIVIDDWTLARMTIAWSYAYVLYFYMLS